MFKILRLRKQTDGTYFGINGKRKLIDIQWYQTYEDEDVGKCKALSEWTQSQIIYAILMTITPQRWVPKLKR